MKEKELKLEIEELEERIAPTWVVLPAPDGTPAGDGIGPTAPSPSSSAPPTNESNDGAWNGHKHADVLED